MATRKRRIEVHRLTISGLVDDTDYLSLISRLWRTGKDGGSLVYEPTERSHLLHSVDRRQGYLWLRLNSYQAGDRPEIINVTNLEIHPSNLQEDETAVYWTHVLVAAAGNRIVMLIERLRNGISPMQIESYLQWMIELPQNARIRERVTADASEPITVSLELETEDSFIDQVLAMDRITSATVRIVRPNPGWRDYDDLLSAESAASDAHYADVSMSARRGATLRKDAGIIDAMLKLLRVNKLGRAVVEGFQGGEKQRLTTERHGKSATTTLPTDAAGVVQEDAAFRKFVDYLNKLE